TRIAALLKCSRVSRSTSISVAAMSSINRARKAPADWRSMKVRTGVIERESAGVLRAGLMLDIAATEIEVLLLTREHFSNAAILVGRHSFTKPLRTLDALQLALAIDLRAQELLDVFIVADKALCEVAKSEGLPVLNPDE